MTRAAMAETGAKPAPIEQHHDETPQPQLRTDFFLSRETHAVEHGKARGLER